MTQLRLRVSGTYAAPVATALLAMLFAFTGLDKLGHYHAFLKNLAEYPVLRHLSSDLLGMPIIAGELLLAVGLLAARHRSLARTIHDGPDIGPFGPHRSAEGAS